MAVWDSLNPSHSHGPFSRVGVSMNCSWAVKSAECRAELEHGVDGGAGRGERRGVLVGHRGVAGQGHDVARCERLARVVDLEVPEAEVVEGMELLGAAPLDVAVAHVGVLGAVRGRHLAGHAREGWPAGLVEQVARPAS